MEITNLDFAHQWYCICCHGNQVYEFAKPFIVGLCHTIDLLMVWYINISLLKLREYGLKTHENNQFLSPVVNCICCHGKQVYEFEKALIVGSCRTRVALFLKW